MSAGTAISGIIVFLLGLVGLAELYGRAVLPFNLAVVSTYLTFDGALLLFGGLAIIGVALFVGGLASPDERKEVIVKTIPEREVVVLQPGVVGGAAPQLLSALEVTVLRMLSQGKSEVQIAAETRVDRSAVSQKTTKLRMEGYITDQNKLTEKGFDTLRLADAAPAAYVETTRTMATVPSS